MGIEIFAIIFIAFTFIILLSGIPVAFVLSGSALLFSFIGISLIGVSIGYLIGFYSKNFFNIRITFLNSNFQFFCLN